MFTFVVSCKKTELPDTSKFSIEDTVNLGENIKLAITSRPADFSIVDPKRYAQAYQFIDNTLAEILNTNEITYSNEYPWNVTLIQDDSVSTSFVLPGGYVFITTGLLKSYINSKSEYFSVIAHEMVYADNGFILDLLETVYSPSSLLDISLGNNPQAASEIADFLMMTPHSESAIFDADKKTCNIVCASSYNANTFSDFMGRLFNGNVMIGWTLLHPDTGFRIPNVNGTLSQLGCDDGTEDIAIYESFVSTLP